MTGLFSSAYSRRGYSTGSLQQVVVTQLSRSEIIQLKMSTCGENHAVQVSRGVVPAGLPQGWLILLA